MSDTSKEIKFVLNADEFQQCEPWLDFNPNNKEILNEIAHSVFKRFLIDYHKDLGETKQYGFSRDFEPSMEEDGKV